VKLQLLQYRLRTWYTLNSSDATFNVLIIAILVLINLRAIFRARAGCVCILITPLHAQFHMFTQQSPSARGPKKFFAWLPYCYFTFCRFVAVNRSLEICEFYYETISGSKI
jgi:hypothetical protein